MSYGNALDRFPVQAGQAWRAGPHRLLCGNAVDLLSTPAWSLLGPEADCVYTDPPWSEALLTSFHRLAGAPKLRSLPALLLGLVAVLRTQCPRGIVGIEMGLASTPILLTTLEQAQAHHIQRAENTYGSKRLPYSSITCSFHPFMPVPPPPHGLHGRDALIAGLQVVGARQGVTLFDPCCGNLTFGVEAISLGATYQGVELIPAKLAQGLEKLTHLGYTPEPIP